MKTFCKLLGSILLVQIAFGQWELLPAQLPFQIGDVRGCIVGDELFAWGKLNKTEDVPGKKKYSGTLMYSFTEGNWSTGADDPSWDEGFYLTAVSDIVEHDGLCYLFGGENDGQNSDLAGNITQIFNASSKSWLPPIANPVGRGGHFAGQSGIIGDYAIWAGGVDSSVNFASSVSWLFDLKNQSWLPTPGPVIPEEDGLSKAVSAYSVEEGFFAMFSGRPGKYKNSDGVQARYLITTETLELGTFEKQEDPLMQNRGGAGGFYYNGSVYMMGGELPDGSIGTVEGLTALGTMNRVDVMDIATGIWQAYPPLAVAVQTPYCTHYDGYAYCVGGGSQAGTSASTVFQRMPLSGNGTLATKTSP